MTLLNINISSERIFLFCLIRHTRKFERSSAQGTDTDDHTHLLFFFFLSKKIRSSTHWWFSISYSSREITPLKFNAEIRFWNTLRGLEVTFDWLCCSKWRKPYPMFMCSDTVIKHQWSLPSGHVDIISIWRPKNFTRFQCCRFGSEQPLVSFLNQLVSVQ